MITSDTSRLFHVGSGGTSLIGGPKVVSIGTDTGFTYPQRHHWVEEIGVATVPAGSFSTIVTIPNSGFSGVPYVFLTQNEPGNVVYVRTGALSVTASSFIINIDDGTVGHVIAWRSLGTRVL